jgi:hypothetical protein
MGRRHVVRDLNDEQFSFVIEAIIEGQTDREISVAFEQTFNQPLAKSSLSRWRDASGNELVERYRLARYQAKQLLTDLGQEDADKFQVVIDNIEDRLLTATRKVIAADPVKLLRIRLDEEKRRLKAREIDLKERQLELELEKVKSAQVDVEALPAQVVEHLLEFIGQDAGGLKWFSANAKSFEKFLTDRFGGAENKSASQTAR